MLADGVTQEPDVTDFTPLANGGRNQLKVRGVGAWDALKAYVQFGIRAADLAGVQDRSRCDRRPSAFIAANCQQCHGGAQWTTSQIRYTPPPDASQIAGGQIVAELRNVGTFDPAASLTSSPECCDSALGAAGFVPPSLLSIYAFPQTFLHNGAVGSLGEVLENVTHRSSGTGGTDILSNPSDRAKLEKFLLSIDAATPPIAP